jgi:GNAT superfamily N-acetyltransferase
VVEGINNINTYLDMNKKLIRLTESDLHRIIKESIYRIITEIDTNGHSKVLFHKSPISCRKSILKKGLLPSVGDSYKAHWDDREALTPYIFLYDHNTINGGEYDSTYDDDIYAVDVSQLDNEHLFNDPDNGMNGCFVYDIPIPTSAIKLVYKGTEGDSDERLMAKHSHIYEGINGGVEFEEYVDEYGDITISTYNNGQLMGYSILVIHKDIYSLESEISETDSYETAEDVISKLRFGKPIVELADVDVKKEYRGFGVSKMLLEYVLSKYNGYQFYLRVCPTDGVDEKTLANSVGRYGFITVTDTENGTFMVKR